MQKKKIKLFTKLMSSEKHKQQKSKKFSSKAGGKLRSGTCAYEFSLRKALGSIPSTKQKYTSFRGN
jgi:hypothetical protein